MGSFSSMDISATGLFAQRVRLDAIANNIANATTTRTERGGPYKRLEVIFKASSGQFDHSNAGVQVESVVESNDPPKMIYDPSHPDAGPDGMVAMPNVNIVEEMVDLISATRAYEANIMAINAARSMVSKALEIGRT
ncbi:MAG: flagellar basal body rod protein FlgC [Armatimonadetes bacterium]|nr:flagellar basal body rod protein FlgC [Armatimonadota bacterium]